MHPCLKQNERSNPILNETNQIYVWNETKRGIENLNFFRKYYYSRRIFHHGVGRPRPTPPRSAPGLANSPDQEWIFKSSPPIHDYNCQKKGNNIWQKSKVCPWSYIQTTYSYSPTPTKHILMIVICMKPYKEITLQENLGHPLWQ